jgi:hypothetical protein
VSTGDLVEILELWRSALREVDATAVGSPERAAAEARAEQRRLEYRAAALRMDARIDEVELAIEATRVLLSASVVTIDDATQPEPERAAAEA